MNSSYLTYVMIYKSVCVFNQTWMGDGQFCQDVPALAADGFHY